MARSKVLTIVDAFCAALTNWLVGCRLQPGGCRVSSRVRCPASSPLSLSTPFSVSIAGSRAAVFLGERQIVCLVLGSAGNNIGNMLLYFPSFFFTIEFSVEFCCHWTFLILNYLRALAFRSTCFYFSYWGLVKVVRTYYAILLTEFTFNGTNR